MALPRAAGPESYAAPTGAIADRWASGPTRAIVSVNSARTASSTPSPHQRSATVHAMATAPSTTARSPDSARAAVAKAGVWMGVPEGAAAIIGWIDGTR